MPDKNGGETKAYYGNAGAEATNELVGIAEDSLSLGTVEEVVTTKGAKFQQYAPIMFDAPVTFSLIWDGANAGHVAIDTAYKTKGLISMLFLEGPKNVAGNKGIGGDFVVTSMERQAPIGGKLRYSVTVKPGKSDTYPVDFRVSAAS